MTTYNVSNQKTSNPVTYKQVTWLRSFDNVSCNVNNSQLMKRLSQDEFQEIIEIAKEGEQIVIN